MDQFRNSYRNIRRFSITKPQIQRMQRIFWRSRHN